MYEPRRASPLRSFKHRHVALPPSPRGCDQKWAELGWLSFVPLSFFCTPPRVVPRIFTYLKKALRYPKSKTRFWVNAQCAHLVTRKPLNVRMGKGKGAKVRCYSKGRGGATMAAASSLRPGAERRIRRFIGIRLGCPVGVYRPTEGGAPLWVRQWRTQASLLRGRAKELKGLLKLTRRPLTKLFFARLFKIAARRPRLKWRSRWPYAPTRSGGLRGRRWRLGSAFRGSTVVWAGLASTALGVRRVRRLRLRGPAPLRPLARALRRMRARRRALRLSGLGLHMSGFGRIAHTFKAGVRPTHVGRIGPLRASPAGVQALTSLWDQGGVRLALARAALGRHSDQAPVPHLQRVGRLQALAATMLTATLELVGGKWRVDPSAGLEGREPTSGGDLIAALVRAKRGAAVLTRSPARPLLLAHLSLWPLSRCPLMAKARPTTRLRPLALGASKHALFGAYLSTLSLVTTSSARLGGPLSSLHGLNYGPGRAYGRPRPLAWAVGPLWGAWSAWFEALVGVFQAGGQCHVAGAGHLALAGRGLEWATGGHRLSRFRPLPQGRPWGFEGRPHTGGHFWLVLRATRGVGEAEPAPEGATFTVGGLHLAPHRGWRSLPGAHGCPHLAAFALSAALVAYQTAMLRRHAAGP